MDPRVFLTPVEAQKKKITSFRLMLNELGGPIDRNYPPVQLKRIVYRMEHGA